MKKTLNLFLRILSIMSCNKSNNIEYRPTGLKCEYFLTPNGVDTDAPRFTWKLPYYSQIKSQLFYQLLVGSDSLKINKY